MFDEKSRYAKLEPYKVPDHRGRIVEVVPVPPAPVPTLMGVHLRRDGERLDHLSAKYLADPAGFWRIAEKNDAMQAEALSEVTEIEIPGR